MLRAVVTRSAALHQHRQREGDLTNDERAAQPRSGLARRGSRGGVAQGRVDIGMGTHPGWKPPEDHSAQCPDAQREENDG